MKPSLKMECTTDRRIVVVLLFDDNKIKVARRPGKKQNENTVGFTGEGKR